MGLLIILGSIFLFLERSPAGKNQIGIVEIGGASVNVEVADTPKSLAKGLSGRKTLADASGMLFVFDRSDFHGIWMKDMNFPIDIVWMDEDFRITGVEKAVSPGTFPRIFYPNQAIRYVLELPAGFIDEHRIDIGEIVSRKR